MSGLVRQNCSEDLLQNEEEEEENDEMPQCFWGGTMDTDQSRALSSSQLCSVLARKRKKGRKMSRRMTRCHFYGDVLADRLRNVWCSGEGSAEGRSDTLALRLPVGFQPAAVMIFTFGGKI